MARQAPRVFAFLPESAADSRRGDEGQEMGLVLGAPVDKTSPVPLYFQIAENLKQAIESGAIQPGERLDNEVQLSERLNVSRPTVRQAIQRLTQEGLVVRQRGVGTVVVNRRIQRRLALSSLYEDLRTSGREPATSVLSVRSVPADEDTAAALGVSPGQSVTRIERVREADGHPLAVMRNYLPADLLQGMEIESVLSRHGLYETLRQRGVQFHSAEEVIGARKATAAEASLLHAPRNSTVLTMTRVAIDPAGRAIEYGVHAYLAERYSFRVALGPMSRA
ncbi:MAG TPA: GntR family transcriptional regulator [Trebonia sp.]